MMNDNIDSLFNIDTTLWSSRRLGTASATLTLRKLMQARVQMMYGHLSKEEQKRQVKRDSDRYYRRSKHGLVRRCWHKMKQRISGKNTLNPELYIGKELLPIQDFVDWAHSDINLQKLYKEWVGKGYDIRYTPSVDRINSERGYTLDNIRWVTHAENSRMGAMNRKYG